MMMGLTTSTPTRPRRTDVEQTSNRRRTDVEPRKNPDPDTPTPHPTRHPHEHKPTHIHLPLPTTPNHNTDIRHTIKRITTMRGRKIISHIIITKIKTSQTRTCRTRIHRHWFSTSSGNTDTHTGNTDTHTARGSSKVEQTEEEQDILALKAKRIQAARQRRVLSEREVPSSGLQRLLGFGGAVLSNNQSTTHEHHTRHHTLTTH